jgi:arginine-tRNA-protein transferase
VEPLETVVFDGISRCPYLPGEAARLPHRQPARPLTPVEFDARLAQGDRRAGPLLYRPACPRCQACEPIRIEVARFSPRTTQRRTKRQGDRLLTVERIRPVVDPERVDLFNAHGMFRGLKQWDEPIDAVGYAEFLTETCCDTWELSYRHDGRLVAVAIVDCGATALSAVYCFYDPLFQAVSLGTYSVLKEIEWCQQTGRTHLYLGYYIAPSPHMSYKALFRPHERLIDGHWQWFE